MKNALIKIRISDIFLDDALYPRENIDHKRIRIFVENLRDGFKFDSVEVQTWPNSKLSVEKGKYRILEGVHRWSAPIVWSQVLKGKDDHTRFKELNWGIRTWWDAWNLSFLINDSLMNTPDVYHLN